MVDLVKRSQTAGVVLAKRGLTAPPIMRVCEIIDISGSFSDEIEDGSVQNIMDQLHGVAQKFDDDGSYEVFKFDTSAEFVGLCEAADYGTFVKKNRIAARGGTAYAPFVKLVTEHYFGQQTRSAGMFGGLFAKKPAPQNNMPVLAFVITDGAPLSEGHSVEAQYRAIRPALEAAQNHPIYWHFIGINNQGEDFAVVRKLADDLPNVGFIKMNGFGLTDEQLYSEVLCDELIQWVKTTGRAASQSAAG